MKCTWNMCGKETGKPYLFVNTGFVRFDPKTIYSAFGAVVKDENLEEFLEKLDAFVCKEHEDEWLTWLVEHGAMDYSI